MVKYSCCLTSGRINLPRASQLESWKPQQAALLEECLHSVWDIYAQEELLDSVANLVTAPLLPQVHLSAVLLPWGCIG